MLRTVGLSLAVSLCLAPGAPAQDARALFDEGVQLLRKGEDEAALKKFEQVLAADPSQEAAYQLWRETDQSIWLEMLVKSDQYERVAKRLMDLARLGRKSHQDDAAAIDALIEKLKTGDANDRRDATLKLSAEHGEYAAARLIPALGDADSPDFRVLAMHTLIQLGGDGVLPLCEAMRSDSAELRRGAAAVLGRIGDRRATGALRRAAEADAEVSVKKAASDALASMGGGGGTALQAYLELGRGYLSRDAGVLKEIDLSDVVWRWENGALAKHPVPRVFYPDELARNAFHDALACDASSNEAVAGIGYAYAAQSAELAALKGSGTDLAAMGDAPARVEDGRAALLACGPAMLDGSLQWAREWKDAAAAVSIVEAMDAAGAPSAGVVAALDDPDKRVRYASAIALGSALPGGGEAGVEKVPGLLAAAVAEDVTRIVHIVDENAARRNEAVVALQAAGYFVASSEGGASGLTRLRRAPGADLIAVSASLTDVTPDQVIDEVKEDFRTAKLPVVVLADAAGAERAQELYGSKAAKIVPALDAATVAEVGAGAMNADREKANAFAEQAASALARLSPKNYDLSGAASTVAGAVEKKDEKVAVPALRFLGNAGGADAIGPCAAVFAETAKPAAVRIAAAGALGKILARTGSADGAAVAALRAGLKDADAAVRAAAGGALGQAPLSAADRAAILVETRTDLKPAAAAEGGGAAEMGEKKADG